MGIATLLLLADGRFPAGGHAHSGGLEAAVAASRVRDLESLRGFLSGRLATTGLVAAAFTAYACAHPGDIDSLELALAARTPSKALRNAARKQGRALCRAGRVAWPSALLKRAGDISQPIALGLVAAAAGLGPLDAATVMAYTTVTGPAGAAVRLLGLDPYEVNALVAALGPTGDETAARAVTYVDGPIDALPANAAPLLDISAEDHAAWEVRLFAS